MSADPSPKGANGRSKSGRFVKGWKGGPGNPNAARVEKLRNALLDAITEDTVREVVEALIKEAKGGNVIAMRELLDRTIGKPKDAVEPDAETTPEQADETTLIREARDVVGRIGKAG